MNIKMMILATILATFTINAGAGQLEKASSLLKAKNVSYIAKTTPSGLNVTTFMHVDPRQTCDFLKNKGIVIISVTNYAKDDKNPDKLIETMREC